MNELVGAWVHGWANGHNGGSHDYWLIFGPNGVGRYVYTGWWLYRFGVFRWNASPSTSTFRVIQPEQRHVDSQIVNEDGWTMSVPAGFHPYSIRSGGDRPSPSLVVSLPGLPAEAEFLLQTRDPVKLSSCMDLSDWRPKF